MQLNREQGYGNIIRSFSAGELLINDTVFTNHLIISSDKIIENWSPSAISAFSIADLSTAIDEAPEVILLGTGLTQTFPPGAVLTDIMRQGIGFEIMDTGAACRTFNVLASEHRRVVAALLIR